MKVNLFKIRFYPVVPSGGTFATRLPRRWLVGTLLGKHKHASVCAVDRRQSQQTGEPRQKPVRIFWTHGLIYAPSSMFDERLH